jgi:hypothetical protein
LSEGLKSFPDAKLIIAESLEEGDGRFDVKEAGHCMVKERCFSNRVRFDGIYDSEG